MNMKWTAKELFNSFKNEANFEEFQALYKALLAREIGLKEYTEEVDKIMQEALDNEYYNNASIYSFIDSELVGRVHQIFQDAEFDVEDW